VRGTPAGWRSTARRAWGWVPGWGGGGVRGTPAGWRSAAHGALAVVPEARECCWLAAGTLRPPPSHAPRRRPGSVLGAAWTSVAAGRWRGIASSEAGVGCSGARWVAAGVDGCGGVGGLDDNDLVTVGDEGGEWRGRWSWVLSAFSGSRSVVDGDSEHGQITTDDVWLGSCGLMAGENVQVRQDLGLGGRGRAGDGLAAVCGRRAAVLGGV
jgi:hypothetical protein